MLLVFATLVGVLVILVSLLILPWLLSAVGGEKPGDRDRSTILVGILVILVGLTFLGMIWVIDMSYGF